MTTLTQTTISEIERLLKNESESLLTHVCTKVPKERLHLPSIHFVDQIFSHSDRSNRVLRSIQMLFDHGRLAHTGYLSILPVDQGVEHSAGASFATNMDYFDPENIIRLAIEGGCNAVASTYGVLSMLSRKYAHKIPFILKLNHNELLTYPNGFDQIFFSTIDEAYEMGAVAVGATIYFGSSESKRQIQEVSRAFAYAHEKGLATILWCYLRNPAFKTSKADYHNAADLTGQANYLGATLGADIVKQKLPDCNGGFKELQFGKTSDKVYKDLCSDHPIDLCRYQVLNSFSGRCSLINSGGSSEADDLAAAARTAVINKRAGGSGLILGRKAFQKPFSQGVQLLNLVQNVYLSKEITIA